MAYHPTPDLKKLMDQLIGAEKEKFFECTAQQLPHTIRFNDLKGSLPDLISFLQEQDFRFESFPGFADIFRIVYQPYPIGKSLSHFLGHIYVQDIASMLPPRILSPQPGELVLDMSAAPGSKTTQMAVLMENKGMILANDIIMKRLRALVNNLQRLGILNTAVVRNYGESIGNQYFEIFDKALLDPACSGLGTLHKSPEVLSWWTPNHCTRLAAGQRSMFQSAIRALKPGGILLYSTCTLTPQENEEVINEALQSLPITILPIELPQLITRPGLTNFNGKRFDKRLENCKRIYPFENQTEGFFLAKIQKLEGMDPPQKRPTKPYITNFISHSTSPVKKYLDYFSYHFDISREIFSNFRYQIYKEIGAVTPELANFIFKTKPLRMGINIARPMKQIGKLTTEGVHLLASQIRKNHLHLDDLKIMEKFVNRESMDIPTDFQHQVIIYYNKLAIGYGLVDQGRVKSQFPKAEWPFSFK